MKKIFISYSHKTENLREINDLSKSLKEKITCKILPFDAGSLIEKYEDWESEIYTIISDSDMVLAIIDNDLSPNLFYEIGYAQGVGKKIILLVRQNAEIPEMFRNFRFFRLEEDNYNLITKSIENQLESTEKDIEALDFNIILKKSLNNNNYINHFSYKDFEITIKNLFEKQGYLCENVKSSHDIGVDLFIDNYYENKKVAVQCKKYDLNKKVALNTILTFLQQLTLLNIDIGLIITTSTFTESAIEFVKNLKDKKIELWDINKLNNEAAHNKG